jgi:hypothetical protein
VTGGFTQNATDGTLFYKIDAINGNVLTIDAGTPRAASENTITVNIAPVILNPSFQATAGDRERAGLFHRHHQQRSGDHHPHRRRAVGSPTATRRDN